MTRDIKRSRFLWAWLLIFATLAFGWNMPGPARAASTQTVRLAVPETVPVGSPFLVALDTSRPLESVQIDWADQAVKPAITRTGETSRVLALLGVGLEAVPGTRLLKVRMKVAGALQILSKPIEIVDRTFPTEALTVAPKMNKPPPAIRARVEREYAAMKDALRTVSAKRNWHLPFHRPVAGIILSRFGLRRTFNNETKRRHKGLDFRAPQGTAIEAIAAGKVILAGDFYLPGKTVMIDHGNGVISISVHLSKCLVKAGDPVSRGQRIGRAGATGRVTGPHLHLTVSVQGITIDPEPLFDMHPK